MDPEIWLPEGIPVAVGAFDAHMGAVGSGIQPGTLVKIIGTSTCDMIVAPAGQKLPDVPGVCVWLTAPVLPGHFALEAGQSAVGDIFNWFVNNIQPCGKDEGSHQKLTEKAAASSPVSRACWHWTGTTVIAVSSLTSV